MIFGKRPPRATRRYLETEAEAAAPGPDDTAAAVIRTPPMKPFARATAPTAFRARPAPAATAAAAPPAAPAKRPAPAQPAAANPRPADVVAQPRRGNGLPAARQGPGHTLVVGRDIRLSGEISACQRLVVEGSVEADLTDTRTLEIADTGHFRGSAVVGTCVVSGSFDGELTVSGLLAVRAGGRVGGAIRYAEIEVERGGRITGRADLQGPQEVRDGAHPAESRPNGGLGLRPA